MNIDDKKIRGLSDGLKRIQLAIQDLQAELADLQVESRTGADSPKPSSSYSEKDAGAAVLQYLEDHLEFQSKEGIVTGIIGTNWRSDRETAKSKGQAIETSITHGVDDGWLIRRGKEIGHYLWSEETLATIGRIIKGRAMSRDELAKEMTEAIGPPTTKKVLQAKQARYNASIAAIDFFVKNGRLELSNGKISYPAA